jgi:Domain of unknown function (DUF4349)
MLAISHFLAGHHAKSLPGRCGSTMRSVGIAAEDLGGLIKITRELAEVQNELEDATGALAVLEKRVDTELLSIVIEPRRQKSFWKPISSAASDFGGSLSQGISSTIIGVAFLLPWTLLIGLLVWVGRKLWRRRNQA